MKVITVVGARPQFIKAAAINRAFRKLFATEVKELILHTGQHYDANMSDVFFQEMELDQPAFHLQIGSGGHGAQTGQMLTAIEEVLLTQKPDLVIVYGDTNSTLAGALAASKLLIPVVHIEAGIRSYNKAMPEEVNRILTDHVSSLLFTPTDAGIRNLAKEGISEHGSGTANDPKVYRCGDIMLDNSLYFAAKEGTQGRLAAMGLGNVPYLLATVHRNTNTDVPERLHNILSGIVQVAELAQLKVVLPLHPRTVKMLQEPVHASLWAALMANDNLMIMEPKGFLDMVALEANCQLIMTDSGGVQKEAYFFQKPCIVLRPETEWVELLASGTCFLADADPARMLDAYQNLKNAEQLNWQPLYGDGAAAEFIVRKLVQHFGV